MTPEIEKLITAINDKMAEVNRMFRLSSPLRLRKRRRASSFRNKSTPSTSTLRGSFRLANRGRLSRRS